MINLDDDEDEPEVLDLENPAFDIRSADELPAQTPLTDLVDRLQFEEDSNNTNAPSSRSQASQCAPLIRILARYWTIDVPMVCI